jgi:pseudouridine synthase
MKSSDSATPKIRLQVFLSHNGVCSRRKAMELIQQGKVTLNGNLVVEPSTPVDPKKDVVCFEGQIVRAQKCEYILLYKPQGYTTTTEDPFAEKIVLDLLPGHLRHLNPVGRLDKNTEGLLLLTNDGQVTQKMTHPSFYVDKVYFATIDGVLDEQDKRSLEQGVIFDDQKTAPAKIFDLRRGTSETTLRITIHEGRKRQIRRMFDALGYTVTFLKRERQGPLTLDGLKPGEWRALTKQEIENIQKL